jgi:hypothetical protein
MSRYKLRVEYITEVEADDLAEACCMAEDELPADADEICVQLERKVEVSP